MAWIQRRGRVIVQPADLHDVCCLRHELREADKAEVWAAHHRSAEQALALSYLCEPSSAFTVFDGEKPIAMFGFIPETILGAAATVWMLGTPGLDAVAHSFARLSRIYIRLMLERYPLLYNFVDARHDVAVNWLRWCGAKFDDPKPFGPDRIPFYYFEFKREV